MFGAASQAYYTEQIVRLQAEVDLMARLVVRLARQQAALAGEQNTDPMIRAVVAAGDAGKQAAMVAEIDKLLGPDTADANLRALRDLTGLTWDEVHALNGQLSGWRLFTSTEKLRYVRRLLFRRAIEEQS